MQTQLSNEDSPGGTAAQESSQQVVQSKQLLLGCERAKASTKQATWCTCIAELSLYSNTLLTHFGKVILG